MTNITREDLIAINEKIGTLIEGVTTSLRAISELQIVINKMAGDEIPDVEF